MKTVSILVVEDHGIARRGLCALLRTQPNWAILEAIDGHEAVSKAMMIRPDVVVIGIKMPCLDGLAAAKQLREELTDLPVVLVGGHSEDHFIDEALEAGVRGYVRKTDADKDLVSAVRAVLLGRTFFAPIVSRRLLASLQSVARRETMKLTLREAEVIQLLCEGKSNKEVASQLGVSRRTVENHRAHIMQKLHLRTFSDLIRYAIRNAIVHP